MTKREFIRAVAEKSHLTQKDVSAMLRAFTEVVTEELKRGEQVQLTGFGTFEVWDRPEKKSWDFKTGEIVAREVAALPRFVPGKTLKDAVNTCD